MPAEQVHDSAMAPEQSGGIGHRRADLVSNRIHIAHIGKKDIEEPAGPFGARGYVIQSSTSYSENDLVGLESLEQSGVSLSIDEVVGGGHDLGIVDEKDLRHVAAVLVEEGGVAIGL